MTIHALLPTTSTPKRRPIAIDNGGAHRGARELLDAVVAYNARATGRELTMRYVDPELGRADELARSAALRGVKATGREATIQEVMRADGARASAPVLLNVDHPDALAEALTLAADFRRATLLYFLILLPGQRLLGVRAALTRQDAEAKRDLATFFTALGGLTARAGSDAVIGRAAPATAVVIEPQLRSWFRSHMTENVARIAADRPPNGAPVEVSFTGSDTMPFFVHDSSTEWKAPDALATAVVDRPPFPIMPGTNLALGEIGPDGVRMYVARLRLWDRRIAVSERVIVDPVEAAALEEHRRAVEAELARREAAAALARSERATITNRNPIVTSD